MPSDKVLDTYEVFMERYIADRKKEIQMDVIKDIIKQRYNDDHSLSEEFAENNVIIRSFDSKKYIPKEEIYDFLDDRGLLPLAVNIRGSLSKEYNIDKAKINFKKTLRVYPGRKKIIDSEGLKQNYFMLYEGLNTEELSNTFKKEYTDFKLKQSELSESREELIDVLNNENISALKTEELGTIRISETYDIDPYTLYDFVAGKKELYLKENESNFEVIVVPDNKKAILPKNFNFNGTELSDYKNQDPIDSSNFIKKREFKKMANEGFLAYPFEVPVDPDEFFRKLTVSRTKLLNLVDRGILTEEEVDNLFTVEHKNEKIVQVLTEGSADKQRDLFFDKLIERSQNQNRGNEDQQSVPNFTNNLVEVGFDDFNF